MIKKRKVEDSPEFRYFEENFDEIIKEMEEDPELQNLKIPDEWDMRFRKTIEDTIKREEKKKNVKEKMLKWGSRVAVVAAGVVLVMFVGMSMSAVTVQGEGLLDVFLNTFDLNGKKYTTVDVGEKVGVSMEEEGIDIYFDTESLERAYEQIRDEFKKPMFYVTYVPERFNLIEAKYNKAFELLNFKFECGKDTIYISQQQQIDEVSAGSVSEDKKCAEVTNESLKQTIEIYESVQDNNLVFNVSVNHTFLVVRCNVSIEEAEKIAKSVIFN